MLPRNQQQSKGMLVGAAIGAMIGVVIGVAAGDLGRFTGVGFLVGMGIGTLLDVRPAHR